MRSRSYAERALGLLLAVLLAGCAQTGGPSPDAARLASEFATVPDADKPWAYWWWLKGNVDQKSITSDLEAMKAAGFGGLLMFDARGYHEGHVVPPPARTDFMSPQWRDLLKYSLQEAHRLGLSFSINLSSDAGALKGPWSVGDDAPKKLIWASAPARGSRPIACHLTRPEGRRFWDIAVLAVRHEADAPGAPAASIDLAGPWHDAQDKFAAPLAALEVIDLTARIDAQGHLKWDAPPGQWTLLRFGCTTMDGHEFDVDVLDPRAVEGHFNRMGRTILNDAGSLAGRTLTHFYSVSWEGAAPTWTAALVPQFATRRGYAIRPWLPALAGFIVEDRAVTDRFLRDYHKTLGDLFMDNFYGQLHKLCRDNGLRWHSESGGPWNRKLPDFQHADQLAFLAQNDMPQGEFWFKGRAMNRPAAMTAHIYGKRLAATEAFTHMLQHWSAYPAALKADADAAFCDGTNQFIWHTFTASPPEFGKPGSEYFAGTHINPNVTWFPQARPFIDYLGRCQLMLRQGQFVADVCCYVGDSPYQHWGRGEKWSEKATLILAKGYAYDLLTTDVLLDRLTVSNGDLVLPGGMRYRALVVDLDDETVLPPVLEKIAQLSRAGATIILGQRRPTRSPGLKDHLREDARAQRLAAQLWGGNPAVVTGVPEVEKTLLARQIPPDFEGPYRYIHRRMGGTEIYFIAGAGEADCTFRVAGLKPEIWDAVTGAIQPAAHWRTTNDGRTVVSLALPENGSKFIVFREPIAPGQDEPPVASSQPAAADAPAPLMIAGPWTVTFEPGRGAPPSATFDTLIAWDQHADAGIRHFSGRAVYRTTFEIRADQLKGAARLNLGHVLHIAEVKLNGRPHGIVWTAPWSVELNGLKPGRNDLEIAVTNTWVNRLIADAALPPEQRITKTNVAFEPGPRKLKIYQSFSAQDPLMPSGLLGPVSIEFGAPP